MPCPLPAGGGFQVRGSWCAGPGSNDVFLRTAPSPEGPWSADVRVFTATPIGEGGLTYAGVAHPYLDETGRSLVISFTNNNNIEVIRVTFAE